MNTWLIKLDFGYKMIYPKNKAFETLPTDLENSQILYSNSLNVFHASLITTCLFIKRLFFHMRLPTSDE